MKRGYGQKGQIHSHYDYGTALKVLIVWTIRVVCALIFQGSLYFPVSFSSTWGSGAVPMHVAFGRVRRKTAPTREMRKSYIGYSGSISTNCLRL